RLVVRARVRRGQIQLSEQGWVMLRDVEDHGDERIDALPLQMLANAGMRAGETGLLVAAKRVRRERRRDHVLAEAPVLECGAGTFAADPPPFAGEQGPIIVRARDLCQDAAGLDGDQL